MCVSVLCPPSTHTHTLLLCVFFFPLGKAAMSPVITGCVFEVSGVLCVYTRLFSHLKATRSPPASPACLLSLALCAGSGSCHCSLGHCPGPVCLSVYLSALVCQVVCPSLRVTLLLLLQHGGASRCLSCCKASN